MAPATEPPSAERNATLRQTIVDARSTGDHETARTAEAALVAENIALIRWAGNLAAKRYQVPPRRMDDVIGEAQIGFMIAVQTWDPLLCGLAYYVQDRVAQQVRAWWEADSGFAGAARAMRVYRRTARLAAELQLLTGREPTDAELVNESRSRYAEVPTVDEIQRGRHILTAGLAEITYDTPVAAADPLLDAAENRVTVRAMLDRIAATASLDREMRVVALRHGLDTNDADGASWERIAATTGLSVGSARRAYRRGLAAIADSLANDAAVP